MKIILSTMTRHIRTSGDVPRICLIGKWLPEMGFEADSLVQAIPEKGGVRFTSYRQHIPCYSELVKETRQQHGKLFPVLWRSAHHTKSPALITSGRYLEKGGLAVGDLLAVCYAYGQIQVKKCDLPSLGIAESAPHQTLRVSTLKQNKGDLLLPKIRLGHSWMADEGFVKDALVSVQAEPDNQTITFWLENEGILRYQDLVKQARQPHRRLIQVSESSSRGNYTPCLTVSGSLLSRAGFDIGDAVIVTHHYGLIRCHKILVETLGFDIPDDSLT